MISLPSGTRIWLVATYKPLKWLDCRQKLYNI